MDQFEKRIKLLCIDEQIMVGMVAGLSDHDVVRLPIFKGLPEGFGVISVNYDPAVRGFVVGIWHKSFPIVGRGVRPMVMNFDVEHQVYKINDKNQLIKAE